MVFAHGFGCDQNMWRFVAPAFEDAYRIVLFDHLGSGGSDLASYDPTKHTSLDGYADDVVSLCRELGIQDGVFPMNVDGGGGDDPEEDARLAYVAITRFMKSLWLTKADYRIGFRDVSYHSSLVDPHGYKLEKIGVVEYDR